MTRIDRPVEDELAQTANQLVVGSALVGDVQIQAVAHRLRAEIAPHIELGQAGEQLSPQLDHILAQLARAGGAPVEVRNWVGPLSHCRATLSPVGS